MNAAQRLKARENVVQAAKHTTWTAEQASVAYGLPVADCRAIYAEQGRGR